MKTFASLVPAAGIALALAPFPATAQSGYYRATLSAAAAKPALVTRDTIWRCADTVCVAPRSGSRDAIMCELVAQRVGTLAGFSVNGSDFDAAALEKCNARGK